MNIKKTARDVALRVTPTFLYPVIRSALRSPIARNIEKYTSISFFSPQWNTVHSGPFAGIHVFYDPSANFWSAEAKDGMHDQEIFDFLLKQKLKGTTIFDIGAHIGFNALCYAKLVGPKGNVVAFEPNRFNRERMNLNLSHNPDLATRINVSPIAISNKNGSEYFYFTNEIEDGSSSGSVIGSIKNKKQQSQYENEFRFVKTKVKTQTLDSFIAAKKIIPDILKVDVEGAESLVVEGSTKLMKKHKPLWLIELHSISNGFQVTKILSEFGYHFTLVKTEDDGRTFIAAK